MYGKHFTLEIYTAFAVSTLTQKVKLHPSLCVTVEENAFGAFELECEAVRLLGMARDPSDASDTHQLYLISPHHTGLLAVVLETHRNMLGYHRNKTTPPHYQPSSHTP